MAYNFNGSNSVVEFGLGVFSGYTVGPYTAAVLFKPAVSSGSRHLIMFSNAASSNWSIDFRTAAGPPGFHAATASTGSTTASTGTWWILAGTRANGTVTPRFHLFNGTTWTHENGGATLANATIGATDRLAVGAFPNLSQPNTGDMVCAGLKKADTADLAVEALTQTAFSSWYGFGFDGLVGFETISTQQNRMSPGSGDEVSRSGITLVSNPAGWSWSTTPASTFVPQIVIA